MPISMPMSMPLSPTTPTLDSTIDAMETIHSMDMEQSWWHSRTFVFSTCLTITAATIGALALLWKQFTCYKNSLRKQKQQISETAKPVLYYLGRNQRARLQGFDWASDALQTDEDGDFAHDFLGPFDNHNKLSNTTSSSKEEVNLQ